MAWPKNLETREPREGGQVFVSPGLIRSRPRSATRCASHFELDELCSYAGLLRGALAWPPGLANDAADQFGFAAFEDPTLDRPIFARAFGARRPDPDAWCFFDTPLTPDTIWILGAVTDGLFRRRRARVLREMVERARQHRAH